MNANKLEEIIDLLDNHLELTHGCFDALLLLKENGQIPKSIPEDEVSEYSRGESIAYSMFKKDFQNIDGDISLLFKGRL